MRYYKKELYKYRAERIRRTLDNLPDNLKYKIKDDNNEQEIFIDDNDIGTYLDFYTRD